MCPNTTTTIRIVKPLDRASSVRCKAPTNEYSSRPAVFKPRCPENVSRTEYTSCQRRARTIGDLRNLLAFSAIEAPRVACSMNRHCLPVRPLWKPSAVAVTGVPGCSYRLLPDALAAPTGLSSLDRLYYSVLDPGQSNRRSFRVSSHRCGLPVYARAATKQSLNDRHMKTETCKS